MTLSEFKAWFEGFSEGIDTSPTEAQFAKIKAKVALIDGTVTTYPVFVDRHWQRPYNYYQPFWSGNIGIAGVASGAVWMNNARAYAGIDPASKGDSQTVTFDIHAAMNALGRAEAMN